MKSPGQLFSSASHFQVGYFLFRVSLGVNIFFHGAMRLITGLGPWVQEQGAAFADNPILPMWAVDAFLYTLPFVEVVLGALLALGLFTHWAVIGGLLMMLTLIFGNTTRQAWATAGNNMHYTLYYYILMARQCDNWLALDNWRGHLRANQAAIKPGN